jgi:Sulfotransferase family
VGLVTQDAATTHEESPVRTESRGRDSEVVPRPNDPSGSLLRRTAQPAPPPPIFIGGAGRSGTTLLRVILDSHSRIACGPELKVLPSVATMWAEFRTGYAPSLQEFNVGATAVDQLFHELIVSLLEPLRAATGKPRIAEKTPNNVFFFHHLHRLFPDSPFVHVVRDGRDVVSSLLTMDWKTVDGKPIAYTRDARLAARYWQEAVNAGRAFARNTAGDSRYFEVRYEALLERPEQSLRSLFAFLGERWEPEVLAFHQRQHALADESSADQVTQPLNGASVGRWKAGLNAADRAAVKAEAGALLVELGYASGFDW